MIKHPYLCVLLTDIFGQFNGIKDTAHQIVFSHSLSDDSLKSVHSFVLSTDTNENVLCLITLIVMVSKSQRVAAADVVVMMMKIWINT